MADNTTINAGTGGDVIATDDVTTLNGSASSGVKVQRAKVTFGDDGTARDVSSSFPLPTTALTDTQLRASAVPVSGTVGVSGTVTATGPLTDTQLRAAAVPVSGTVGVSGTIPVSGPATDAQLRATPLPVSGTVTATGPLTDTQLRATAVPVSGTVAVSGTLPVSGPATDAQLRATPLPVSGTVTATGPLTDTQLRASAVPVTVSGVVTVTDGAGSITVDGVTAAGVAPAGNPVLNAGSDGTLTRTLLTDASGRQIVTNALEVNPTATSQTVTAVGVLAAIPVEGYRSVHVQGFGTHSGVNLTFEVSLDGGTNYVGRAVSATGNPSLLISGVTGVISTNGSFVYRLDLDGATHFRVNATAWTSGTLNLRIRPTVAPANTHTSVIVSGTVTVDSELTAPASLSDGGPNPTVPLVGNANLVWNGATWDRQRANTTTINVDTSSARTATGNGTAYVVQAASNVIAWINVTAVSGTSPTCQFRLQWSPDNGTTWLDLDTTNLQATAITAATTQTFRIGVNVTTAAGSATGGAKQDLVPRQLRLAWTIGGTTPSFTFASWYTTTG